MPGSTVPFSRRRFHKADINLVSKTCSMEGAHARRGMSSRDRSKGTSRSEIILRAPDLTIAQPIIVFPRSIPHASRFPAE